MKKINVEKTIISHDEKEVDDVLDRRISRARSLFQNNFNCCQSVIGPFAEDLGLSEEMALRIGSGFGGGLRNGEVCGAISGSIMALGLKVGHYEADNLKDKERANQLTSYLMDKFYEKYSTVRCKDILGCEDKSMEEWRIVKSTPEANETCFEMIEDAVRFLHRILLDLEE